MSGFYAARKNLTFVFAPLPASGMQRPVVGNRDLR
jgi:hypothetical protein